MRGSGKEGEGVDGEEEEGKETRGKRGGGRGIKERESMGKGVWGRGRM